MFSLIILFIFGFLAAIFAVQNTQSTSITFGQYGLLDVPLFAIVLAAVLLGVFISWLISLTGNISTSMAMRGKEGKIRDAESRIHKLEERNHDLELEIARLRGEDKAVVHRTYETHNEHEEEHHDEHRSLNPFVRFRQRFS